MIGGAGARGCKAADYPREVSACEGSATLAQLCYHVEQQSKDFSVCKLLAAPTSWPHEEESLNSLIYRRD